MSSTPTITSVVQSEVSALAHRHLTLTYSLVGTIILLLALMGFGGYLGLKSFDAQLARAEKQEQQYQQDRSQWQAALAQHDTERSAQALQIQQLQSQVNKRDTKPLPPAVQAGMTPDASSQAIAGAVSVAYSSVPGFGQATTTPEGQVALTGPQAQATVTAKLEGDRDKADLKDTQAIVALQGQTVTTLKVDLKGCQDTVGEANKTIADYKKAAVKSRWKKFLGGAEKAGLFIGGVYLGHKL